MAETAYQVLLDKVKADQLAIKDLQRRIYDLENEPGYRKLLLNFQKTGGITENNGLWVDDNGNIYQTNSPGQETNNIRTHARDVVIQFQDKIRRLKKDLDDYTRPETGQLAIDQAAVVAYEQSSPVLSSQIESDKQVSLAQIAKDKALAAQAFVSANSKTLVILLVVVIVLVIGYLLLKKYNKKNKTTATT